MTKYLSRYSSKMGMTHHLYPQLARPRLYHLLSRDLLAVEHRRGGKPYKPSSDCIRTLTLVKPSLECSTTAAIQ